MNITPVSGKLVIKKYVEEPTMNNGIITMPKEYPNIGIIHNIATDSKYIVGQKVFFNKFGSWHIEHEDLIIICETEVMAVVE
jgi:co-chaperonin GroES (HSP10)